MMAARSNRECVRRTLLCVLNLVVAVESFVAVMVFDQSKQHRQDSTTEHASALVTVWVGGQYAVFGASVAFAGAVWLSEPASALVLFVDALVFALCALQWLALAFWAGLAGLSTSAALFAALALQPLAGFALSCAAGRIARDAEDRQEALDIVFEHEESLYHREEA